MVLHGSAWYGHVTYSGDTGNGRAGQVTQGYGQPAPPASSARMPWAPGLHVAPH